jgi:hypothetical protein
MTNISTESNKLNANTSKSTINSMSNTTSENMNTINVLIRNKEGNKYPATIELTATIAEVKRAVAGMINIPAAQQRMFFSGAEVPGETVVGSLGLRSGSALFVVKGVAPAKPSYQQPFGNTNVFGLRNRTWVVSKFDQGRIRIPEEARLHHSLVVEFSKNTKIIVPKKINHIDLVGCHDVTIIFRGVVSSIELTRCENVKLFNFGPSSTIQVDLSKAIHIYLSPGVLEVVKIVTSNTGDVFIKSIYDQSAEEILLPISYFSDQMVSQYDKETKEVKSINTKLLKSPEGGYTMISDL